MVRTRLFVVALPAGRKEPLHTVWRWPGVELLPGRADMESAPTEGIGRKGNNNEVPRASNARSYIVLQFIKTKTPPALAGKRCLFIKLSD